MRGGVSLILALSTCLSITTALPQPALVLRGSPVNDHKKPKYSVVPLEPGEGEPGGGNGEATVEIMAVEEEAAAEVEVVMVPSRCDQDDYRHSLSRLHQTLHQTSHNHCVDDSHDSTVSDEQNIEERLYLESCYFQGRYYIITRHHENSALDFSVPGFNITEQLSSRYLFDASKDEHVQYNFHRSNIPNPNPLGADQLYDVVFFLGDHDSPVEH
ncbi:hypothetical protein TrVFT333_007346 [Trichoderma virens FT-333]|nr:hypothetical protein TrVFT333_007346 [Trichoderma virens FT-333]